MSRAVSRVVVVRRCFRVPDGRRHVGASGDDHDGNQEVRGHRGGRQPARCQAAGRHEGNDRAGRLPVHRERAATVGERAEARHGGNGNHHHEDRGHARHRHRSEERDRDAGRPGRASSFAPTRDSGSFTQGEVDKRGVKIMRHGKPAEVSEFHSGDKLSATIITTMPPKVVTEKEVQATLASSGAGGAAPPPRLRVRPSGAATPAATSGSTAGAGEPAPAAPKTLPKTASPLPLVGLVGLASLLTGVALTVRRRRVSR